MLNDLSSAGFEVGWRGLTHRNRKLHRQAREQFYGAAATERLKLTTERLEKLPGCNMIVEWTGHSFKGLSWTRACIVFRKGTKTYLDSEFEIDQDKFISLDRGRDPETNEHIWGSYAGPFQFVRWGSLRMRWRFRGGGAFELIARYPIQLMSVSHALNPSLPAAIGIRLSSRNPGYLWSRKFRALGLKLYGSREYR